MQDFVIRQYQRHHGFHYRRTPNADTGIVPALGSYFGRLALTRHALDGRQYRTGGLECYAAGHGLSGGDASCNAAGVIGFEPRPVVTGSHGIGILFAGQARSGKAVADLHALDGIDAHHASSKIGIELGIDRRAPSCRDTRCHAFHYRAKR